MRIFLIKRLVPREFQETLPAIRPPMELVKKDSHRLQVIRVLHVTKKVWLK